MNKNKVEIAREEFMATESQRDPDFILEPNSTNKKRVRKHEQE